MRRFLIWLLIIVGTLIAADFLFGVIFNQYMKRIGLKGDYISTEKVLRNFDYDLAVLGSSVALNSINTATLQDSLNLSSINGASNGQAFPYYLSTLKAIVAQKAPKHVLLGLIPENLYDTGLGNRYNFLAPYYGHGIGDIDSCMHSKDRLEPLLLKSNLYRLNTIWFRIFLYNFITAGITGENGFIAKPIPPQVTKRIDMDDDIIKPMSNIRRKQLVEFIEICKSHGINLRILITPRCVAFVDEYSNPTVTELFDIGRQYGIAVYDDSNLKPFNYNDSLFYDNKHININGSKIYTDTIINRLK